MRNRERILRFTVKAISNVKSDADVGLNSQTEEVLREWRESAPYWQKHLGTIRTMFNPITQALIEDAPDAWSQGWLCGIMALRQQLAIVTDRG